MVAINVGHVPGSDALEKVVTATLRRVFPNVIRDRVSADNSLLLASTGPLSPEGVIAAASPRSSLPPELDSLASSVGGHLGPALPGGTVYTDDRAPVEWLTDLSLLHYAEGTR